MSLVRALARRVLTNKRKLQDELDVWRLYHFLFYRKQISEGTDLAELKFPDQNVSYRKQYTIVHAAVTQQVISLLNSMAALAAAGQTEPSQRDSSYHLSPSTFDLVVARPPSADQPIPGVELRGEVSPGTVLCFYPGTVYLPLHQKDMPNYPEISHNNPYLMSRTDDSIIDAHQYTMEEVRMNPLAVGHMIRHPPKGKDPNIMPFSYDVGLEISDQLLSRIPNRYYREPGWMYSNQSRMRTIVFVSMRTLKNEELFLNYRLHPKSQVPDWYSTVDDKENERRWTL